MKPSASEVQRESERAEIARRIAEELTERKVDWALQRGDGAVERWARGSQSADLDLWVGDHDAASLEEIMTSLGAVRIIRKRARGWPQHDIYVIRGQFSYGLVDFTIGDLSVGPLMLCRAERVRVSEKGGWRRLQGVAAVTDLLLRPLLRGSLPAPGAVQQAREAWSGLSRDSQQDWLQQLAPSLGARFLDQFQAVLNARAEPAGQLVRAAGRRLLVEYLKRPGFVRALLGSARLRLTHVGHPRPFGHPVAGLLIALIGTDGAGKTTVSNRLSERLRAQGFRVRESYFGRARGNLPGVAAVRRFIDVRLPSGSASARAVQRSRRTEQWRIRATLLRVASWYYVFEYLLRAFATVSLYRATGRIVILDRYVYDLSIMQGASKTAAKVARALCPAPDLVVLLDAPLDEIRARKPERSPAEASTHQATFRTIIEERPGRLWSGTIATSCGAGTTGVDMLARRVLAASHWPYNDSR